MRYHLAAAIRIAGLPKDQQREAIAKLPRADARTSIERLARKLRPRSARKPW